MIKLLKFLKINFFYFSFNNKKMVITRENFAELFLHDLLYNIYSYAEYIIKGNCASFLMTIQTTVSNLAKDSGMKLF